MSRKKPRTRSTLAEKPDLFDDLPDDLVVFILCKLSASASRPSDLVGILVTYAYASRFSLSLVKICCFLFF
jgi:hypothetical protein